MNGRIYESSASSAKLASEFSLDDIRYMSKIAYEHSGTETTNDSFVIQVSDGEHTSQLTVSILIYRQLGEITTMLSTLMPENL